MTEYDFYSHKKLGENLWVIYEQFAPDQYSFAMYVVTGTKKAVVIDTGMGVTSILRDYIEENITKLPVAAYATHGDLDHMGGHTLFDEYYLNERELPKLDWNLNVERRFSDLKQFAGGNMDVVNFCRDHYVHNENFRDRMQNVDDGDVIDLGGEVLEVIMTPGHTPGSVSYYNRARNYCIMGDACTPTGSWQRCRDLSVCLKYNNRAIDMLPEDIVIWDNHNKFSHTKEKLREISGAIEEILAGKWEGEEPFKLMFEYMDPEELTYDTWKHFYGNTTVPYDRNTVHLEK